MAETWAVLATGPSLCQTDIDKLQGRCNVVAVSDAYKLCPWADCLASTDQAWWDFHNPDFKGRKFGVLPPLHVHVERVDTFPGMNSGALGIMVAQSLGAKRILMLGFDLTGFNGAHFFGDHPDGLKCTPEHQFTVFINQLNYLSRSLASRGVELINCTAGSAFNGARMVSLDDALNEDKHGNRQDCFNRSR